MYIIIVIMVKNWLALPRTFTFEIWKKKILEKLFDSQKFPKNIETKSSLIFEWFLKFWNQRLFFKNQTTHITFVNTMVILYKLKSNVWYGIFNNSFFHKLAKLVKATPPKKHIYAKVSRFLCKQWQKILKIDQWLELN